MLPHHLFNIFLEVFIVQICVQKEVIHNNYIFKKSHFRHVTSYELTHFKEMVQVSRCVTSTIQYESRKKYLLLVLNSNNGYLTYQFYWVFVEESKSEILSLLYNLFLHGSWGTDKSSKKNFREGIESNFQTFPWFETIAKPVLVLF